MLEGIGLIKKGGKNHIKWTQASRGGDDDFDSSDSDVENQQPRPRTKQDDEDPENLQNIDPVLRERFLKAR